MAALKGKAVMKIRMQ